MFFLYFFAAYLVHHSWNQSANPSPRREPVSASPKGSRLLPTALNQSQPVPTSPDCSLLLLAGLPQAASVNHKQKLLLKRALRRN